MSNKDVIDKIKSLSTQEQRNISYDELIKIIEPLTADEIIELSNYREFGARKIDKIIKNDIETIIINDILNNEREIYITKIKKEKVIN